MRNDTVSEEEHPLYIGIRHAELFRQLGYTFDKRALSERGVYYITLAPQANAGKKIDDMKLAVHLSVEKAIYNYKREAIYISVGPILQGTDIGSQYGIWSGDGSRGSLLLREKNVTISYRWQGDVEDAKRTARKIVDILRTDRQVTTLGSFASIPEVRNRMPHLVKDSDAEGLHRFQPDIVGFMVGDTLLIDASLRERKRYPVQRDDDGWVLIDLRGKTRPKGLILHVANQENVFFSESVALE